VHENLSSLGRHLSGPSHSCRSTGCTKSHASTSSESSNHLGCGGLHRHSGSLGFLTFLASEQSLRDGFTSLLPNAIRVSSGHLGFCATIERHPWLGCLSLWGLVAEFLQYRSLIGLGHALEAGICEYAIEVYSRHH
jgi:hypothetical protein